MQKNLIIYSLGMLLWLLGLVLMPINEVKDIIALIVIWLSGILFNISTELKKDKKQETHNEY